MDGHAVRVVGRQSFHASRGRVWSLLNDPAVLRRSIPGCQYFHLHADGKYHFTVDQPVGPFAGSYKGIISAAAGTSRETIELSLLGSGPQISLNGDGIITLEESHGLTILHYQGDIEPVGPLVSRSPRLVQTTANALIRPFLEAIDEEIERVTGAPGQNCATSPEHSAAAGASQDFAVQLRRDRWTAVFILTASLAVVAAGLSLLYQGLRIVLRTSRKLLSR